MLKLYEVFGGSTNYRQRVQKETGTIKNCFEWKCSNSILVEQFQMLGFKKHTDSIPKENLYDFLLGYLDGDGCIYHNGKIFQVTFCSKSEENWDWFVSAVKRITDIKFKINKRTSWCKQLNKKTASSIARLTSNKALQFSKLLYNNCIYGLERKKVKYLNYIEYKNGFKKWEDS